MKRWRSLLLGLVVLLGSILMFDAQRADRAVKFFQLLKHTKGQFYGKPFVLLPWQKKIVRDVYGTINERGVRQYTMAVLWVPKKNGKSELAAGAGLYHTFGDGERNGEVYGAAADKGQASLVFDVAVEMIDQDPALKKRAKLNLSTKMITDKVSGTTYKVVSSEAYTKHGLNVSACIFDELHAQPNRDLWDVMTKGAGDARLQPIWWVISTAGEDPDRVSIGWEVYEKCKAILEARENGDQERDIKTWYPVIFEYEGDDIYNPDNWEKANPSLGVTFLIERMEEAAAEAKLKEVDEISFRWLRLNQWLTYKLASWLPLDLFDKTNGDWSRVDLLGRDCYLGLDLSSTTDLSALAAVFPPQGDQSDWRVIFEAWIPELNMRDRIKHDKVPYDKWVEQRWITPTEGDVIDYTLIEAKILEYTERYNVKEVNADRALATMLLQRLEAQGIECVDIPQTFKSLTDPLNVTEVLLKGKLPDLPDPDEAPADGEGTKTGPVLIRGKLLAGNMTHEPNPVARWCFGNTSIAKNGQGYIKYVKLTRGGSVIRTKRIDLTAAWVTAMARARFYEGPRDLSAEILDPEWGM